MKMNKQTFEATLLILYTWLNLRMLYPFVFGSNYQGMLIGTALQTNGSNLLALFVGLFLNVALILYWVNKK